MECLVRLSIGEEVFAKGNHLFSFATNEDTIMKEAFETNEEKIYDLLYAHIYCCLQPVQCTY